MAKNPKIKIIGAPIDLGAQRLGVDMGPNALRYAGIIPALRKQGIDVVDSGNIPVPTPESLDIKNQDLKYLDEIAEVSEILAKTTRDALKDGYIPVALGGDHSLAIGSTAGIADVFDKRFGAIWLDAHPDCNTSQTTMSGNIHGMALAVALGCGDKKLVNCLNNGPKLKSSNVCLLGAKDFDHDEKLFLREKEILTYTMDNICEIGMKTALEKMREQFKGLDGVYVSLDLDVIDCTDCPGVGIRSHGGFSYREIKYICKAIGRLFNIIGIDLVEFNPIYDRDNQTANLSIELILALLGYEYGDYQRYLEIQTV
jgi:arginase